MVRSTEKEGSSLLVGGMPSAHWQKNMYLSLKAFAR